MENAKKDKRNKIVYWIFTIWMCLGMSSSGILQVLKVPEEIKLIEHLGYPLYFLVFLGVMKLLGVVVVLAPKWPLLKEWAYAGFFFTMLGALYSHVAMSDTFKETFPPIFLIILILISWYFRPVGRKIVTPQTT